MIHINLNMVFYTHVEHSPTKTMYIKYYTKNNTNKKRTTNTYTPATAKGDTAGRRRGLGHERTGSRRQREEEGGSRRKEKAEQDHDH